MIKVFNHIAELVTLESAHEKDGRNLKESDLSLIQDAAVVTTAKEILWCGKSHDLPTKYKNEKSVNCSDYTILPSWVDAHTHIVFAGDRSHEYSMRLNGATYEEIAKAGGGIVYTMGQTKDQSFGELYIMAKTRLEKMYKQGVSTVEIKSGYGLTLESEEKMTRVIHKLKQDFVNKITISNTFMPAHAVPKNFSNSKEYMDKVVLPLLAKLAPEKMIDAVDIFHEKNYFGDEDVKSLFTMAQKFGIQCKMHADELNDNGGAKLAVSFKALSCDHLLQINDEGIQALANSQTVAILLPGTGFFLGKNQTNARKLLDQGVKVAIASDFNPGSCHFDHVFKLAQFIAPTYKMNRAELICALTLNPSHALNLHDQGVIKVGMKPKFSFFHCQNLDKLLYEWNQDLFFSHALDMLR